MKNFALGSSLCLLIVFSSCKKKKEEQIDPIPFLEIESISATTVQEYDSNVVLKLLYRDEDGDLGFDHPDSLSLYIHDSRLENPDRYFVPLLSPPADSLHIQGGLDVTLVAPFLLGNGNSETLNYSVWIFDRKHNVSNIVVTDPITIIR